MPNQPRIPALDGLRGIAVAMVVAHHYWGVSGDNAWQRFLNTGWVGVDLFFGLSGFLITRIVLLNSKKSNFLPVFLVRRLLRIVLPYYVFLACAFFTAIIWQLPLVQAPWAIFALNLQAFFMAITNQTYFSYLGITWSLSWEEMFYFILPLFARLGGVANLPILAIGGIILAPALRCLHSYYYPVSGVLLLIRPDSLFWGILLALGETSTFYRDLLKRRRGLLKVGAVLLSAGLMAVIYRNKPASLSPHASNVLCSAVALWSVVVVSLVLHASPTGFISRFVTASALRYLGRISFSIYLYHQLFAFWASRLYPAAPVFSTGMALAATLLWAAKSWEWWEGPLVRMGQGYAYSQRDSDLIN